MSEFFREVDEEYRRDQIARIWSRYSGVFVALAVLLVGAVGGWRYWQGVERSRAEAAGARYEQAVRDSREDRGEDAEKALAALAQEAPNGYALLARFRLAAERGRGAAEEGAAAYDALAGDATVPPLWRDLARLRAAMLRIDSAEPAALRQALEPLASPTGPWRHTARELLGLTSLKAGDTDAAGRWFEQIATDRETPQGLRSRLEVYTALVAGGPVKSTQ